MFNTLDEHDEKFSRGGRTTCITSLQLAGDIDAHAEERGLEALVESLDKTCIRYEIEIKTEKIKLIKYGANGIQSRLKVKCQKLETVTSFKYLGVVG